MPAPRDEITNELIFERLRAIQQTLARHSGDLREIKERLGKTATQIGGLAAQYASLSVRFDRLDARLERVERQLDLVWA